MSKIDQNIVYVPLYMMSHDQVLVVRKARTDIYHTKISQFGTIYYENYFRNYQALEPLLLKVAS